MRMIINYDTKRAYITGAVHPDGREYVLKGLKKKLQDQAKADGMYGIEFWNHAENKYDRKPGEFRFEILDMYGRL